MERNSRKLIKMLEADGWTLVRVAGDHHIFEHADRPDVAVVVTHPRKDLSPGLVRAIYRLAGWR